MFGFVLLSAGHSAAVLRKAALTDHLTGLPNRRAFEAMMTMHKIDVAAIDAARKGD